MPTRPPRDAVIASAMQDISAPPSQNSRQMTAAGHRGRDHARDEQDDVRGVLVGFAERALRAAVDAFLVAEIHDAGGIERWCARLAKIAPSSIHLMTFIASSALLTPNRNTRKKM